MAASARKLVSFASGGPSAKTSEAPDVLAVARPPNWNWTGGLYKKV